jgi:hypothetical protein
LQVVQRLQSDFIWGDTLLMGENTMLFNGSWLPCQKILVV